MAANRPTTAAPPHAVSFSARVNGICRAARGTALSTGSLQGTLGIGLVALRKLRTITPPPAEAARYTRLLATARTQGQLFRRAVAAEANGDQTTKQQFLDMTLALERRVDAQATALGLDGCTYPVPGG